MELTTKNWKEFRIGDLFDCYLGKSPNKQDITEIGNYPVISAQTNNNGIIGYTDCEDRDFIYDDKLTLGNRGSYRCFYQKGEFYAGNNVIVFDEKVTMNKFHKLFIAALINKLNFCGYTKYPTKTNIVKETLLLPSKNNEPDWGFMEEFIKGIEEENKEKLAVLKDVKPVDDEIDMSDWHEFRVGDLFETLGGKRVPTGSYVKKAVLDANLGQIPRITVTGLNNGIDGYYNESINDSNYRIYENFISVTFLGDCFYQKHKASLDMKVHCLKLLNIDLNEKIALFLITTLKKEMLTYNYGDQLNSENLKDIILKLPSKNDQPDWEYMEDFITNQQEKIKNQLKELRR